MTERIGGAALVFVFAVAQSASTQQPPDRQVFRTGTNLAIIDAVVVDDRGRHVRDLTAEDFEVVQQGKTHPARQALYVPAGTTVQSAAAEPPRAEAAPPAAAAPGRVSTGILSRHASPAPDPRVMAIVVDDLGLSFEGMAGARHALTKFVNEEVGPGDLVAILRTSGGVGTLQQFTTDKRLLHAAIGRLNWTILSRSGVTAFAPIVPGGFLFPPATSGTAEVEDENSMDGLRTSMSAAGSLGALDYIIRGVETLPGRKSVVFISEGLRLFTKPEGMETQGAGRVWNTFTRVMDRANRAGVVVYTMDARGLVSGGLSAEDNPRPEPAPPGRPSTPTGDPLGEIITQNLKERLAYLRDTQEALTYIAEQTGGFAVLNTNDLAAGLRRVRDDAGGYYLLGFEGAPASLRSWDPGRVTVRVKRPGLRVRARKGLFGPSDPGREPPDSSGDSLIMAALSPFSAGALDVRLTALFAHDAREGSFVRSLFFIDPAGVRFTQRADGRHVANLTLALLAIGDDGKMATQWRRAIDLQLTDATYELARKRGILYTATIPLKKAGAYQLRVAVRDESTTALGSGSQFVEVPLVGKGRVAISGIVLQGADATPVAEPAVRIFPQGGEAVYACEIYDGAANSGPLTTTTAVIRDGTIVHQEAPVPVESTGRRASVHTVPVVGRVPLRTLSPGSYTLQITAARVRNGKATPQATQWATFEVQ
jgi:VWFA-related protein